MRVLFINDSTSSSNWGDRAAAISLAAMVTEAGGDIIHRVSEDELAFSSFDTAGGQIEPPPESKVHELARLLTPAPLRRLRRKLVKNVGLSAGNRAIPERWEDFERAAVAVLRGDVPGWSSLLAAMSRMDLAVIHGDGAMVGNGVIPRTDLFLAYLCKKHFAKPVIIVNHSAQFDHPGLRAMAERVYPLFDDVVFRDPLSAERCREFCDGLFAADTSFWFEPAPRALWLPLACRPTYFDVWPDTAAFDPSAPYICVGGSSLHSTAWHPRELANEYVALLRYLRSLSARQIVLTLSGLQELELFRPVARELGLPLVAPTTPVQQAVDILGNADAYVGGRWHSAIFALRGGVPVVPLGAKQAKMQALMLAADLPETAFDAFRLDDNKDAIGARLLEHLDAGQELKTRLRRWADDMAESSWDNVAYLRRFQTSSLSEVSS